MAHKNPPYTPLGELILRLILALERVKGKTMIGIRQEIADTTGYSAYTVYRWQQGNNCPGPETLEILAEIGRKQADLPREWGENLLRAGAHPDAQTIVHKLWGPTEIRSLPCNLPNKQHDDLIGRQAEMDRLLELISPKKSANPISIGGIGGVGKTALVLEAAHRCWKASTSEQTDRNIPIFDAIIFVSAKKTILTPWSTLPRAERQETLDDIFREIARTLSFDVTSRTPEDHSRVKQALKRQRTLLIIDNLETLVESEKEKIMSFVYDLPASVKAVITTRENVIPSHIRLNELIEIEASRLIEKAAQDSNVEMTKDQISVLYQHLGGIPAALLYAVGQIAIDGCSVATVIERVRWTKGDVARFCFKESMDLIRDTPAATLLMAISLFPKPAHWKAAAQTAGLTVDRKAVDDVYAKLHRLSLASEHDEHYSVLPLTREYALAELAEHPDPTFEPEMRKHFIQWCLDFTEEHGGEDFWESQEQYRYLEEEFDNILAASEYCAAHNDYHSIRALWQGEIRLLNFADIYGYWRDALKWLSWLIKEAEAREEWSTAMEARGAKGLIHTLRAELDDADKLFQGVYDHWEDIDPLVHATFAQKASLLRIYQGRYEEAGQLLQHTRDVLEKTQQVQLDERERTRRIIFTDFFEGFRLYKMKHFSEAEPYFERMEQQAQAINWQRAEAYALNFRANIAITFTDLDKAELLLKKGYSLVNRIKDPRHIAHYCAGFARLWSAHQNIKEAQLWAKRACDEFERLAMQREVDILTARYFSAG